MNPNDRQHQRATAFAGFDDDEVLLTTNDVVEAAALVQRRLGMATPSTLRHDVLAALAT